MRDKKRDATIGHECRCEVCGQTMQQAPSSFVPAPGSVAALAGITMKDLRAATLRMPHMDKVDFVRVSDGWWVKLEDGKPCAIIPHGPLMQIIQENFSPPNDELKNSGPKTPGFS